MSAYNALANLRWRSSSFIKSEIFLVSRRFFALLVCFAFVPRVKCQERKFYSLVKNLQTTHRRSCHLFAEKDLTNGNGGANAALWQLIARDFLHATCMGTCSVPNIVKTYSVILALWFYNGWWHRKTIVPKWQYVFTMFDNIVLYTYMASIGWPIEAINGFWELTNYCECSKKVRWKMTGKSYSIFWNQEAFAVVYENTCFRGITEAIAENALLRSS